MLLSTRFPPNHQDEENPPPPPTTTMTTKDLIEKKNFASARGMFYSRHAKHRSDSLVFLLGARGDAYAFVARDGFAGKVGV